MEVSNHVAIVVDSAISLPRETIEDHGLIVVPMKVTFEGKSYRDGLDMEVSEFYRRLRRAQRLPTTSAPSPSAFLQAFREASERTNQILCLTVASRFSTTHNSARLAVESASSELPEVQIELFDTSTAAAAQALVTLEAARSASRGMSLQEVRDIAQQIALKVSLVASLDTLYYLWKGGRVPIVGHWITSVLKIKPILELAQGDIRMVERPRTRKKATKRLLEILRSQTSGSGIHAIVVHAHCLEEAKALRDRIAAEFQCEELLISEFSPVLGAHIGPGLLGVAFWPE